MGAGSAPATPGSSVPPGYSSEILHVRFEPGTAVSAPENLLPPEIRPAVAAIERLFTLPEAVLADLKTQGERRLAAGGPAAFRPALPDLNLWFRLILAPGADGAQVLAALQALDSVAIAEPAPLPHTLPADTPDFSGMQGYLEPATAGVDALYAWTYPGGDGSGRTIYDVEYSWNQAHEDLSAAWGVPMLLDPGDASSDPFNDNNHGTAVLGELIADQNGLGVTGISWGAAVGLAPANTVNLGYNPANAIALAAADAAPGDVILIEQQTTVCGLPAGNYGPSEWISSVFDAIQIATALGVTVVEAAGNGAVDLDQPGCLSLFDPDVRDSGALIVGAGRPPASGFDRERASFSTYCRRVDLQGWSSLVMTAGYGNFYVNPDDPANPNHWYTAWFGGTSAASPLVAGGAANLQGIALAHTGDFLLPFELRALLVATGSPQLGNTAEHIGPRPDLRAAIDQLLVAGVATSPALYAVGSPGETVTHTVWITNTGTVFDTFDLIVSGNDWQSDPAAGSLTLGPGEAGSVAVYVTIPVDALHEAIDTAGLSAISRFDPEVNATTPLTTTALVPETSLYLPVIIR